MADRVTSMGWFGCVKFAQVFLTQPPLDLPPRAALSMTLSLLSIVAAKGFLDLLQMPFLAAVMSVCLSSQFLINYDLYDGEGSPSLHTCLWKLGIGCVTGVLHYGLFFILGCLAVWCHAPSLYLCVPFTEALAVPVLTSLASIVASFFMR